MTPSSAVRCGYRVLVSGAIVGAVLTAWAALASADVPPPPGYVESCTVALQQSATALCEECGTYYAEAQKCVTQYDSTPFQKRCQTQGASAWTEVWCRPRTPADPSLPAAAPAPLPRSPSPGAMPPAPSTAPAASAETGSCSVIAAGRGGRSRRAPWVGLGLGLLLLFVRARRR